MENLNPATESRLNNELLSAEPVDNKGAPQADKKPKRNSKDDLTKKILQVVEKYQLDFEYSVACPGDGAVRENRHGQGGGG